MYGRFIHTYVTLFCHQTRRMPDSKTKICTLRIIELKSWESQLHIFWKMGMEYATIDEGIIHSFVLSTPPINQILKAEVCEHSLKENGVSQPTVPKHSYGWWFAVNYETPSDT